MEGACFASPTANNVAKLVLFLVSSTDHMVAELAMVVWHRPCIWSRGWVSVPSVFGYYLLTSYPYS